MNWSSSQQICSPGMKTYLAGQQPGAGFGEKPPTSAWTRWDGPQSNRLPTTRWEVFCRRGELAATSSSPSKPQCALQVLQSCPHSYIPNQDIPLASNINSVQLVVRDLKADLIEDTAIASYSPQFLGKGFTGAGFAFLFCFF